MRKEQNFSWFYSELKHHRIAHYIYYLATDNIRIITHDDTVLLLRGTRNLLKVSTTKNPAKIKEAALLHICGKSTFREYCSTLAGAGVFRWVTDVNHNKRSYYAIDNTLLYIEDVENNNLDQEVSPFITFVKGKKRKHRKSHGYIVGYGSNGYCYKDSKGNFHYYVTKSPLQTVLDVNRQGLESALGGGWVQAPENAHWHGFEYHR